MKKIKMLSTLFFLTLCLHGMENQEIVSSLSCDQSSYKKPIIKGKKIQIASEKKYLPVYFKQQKTSLTSLTESLDEKIINADISDAKKLLYYSLKLPIDLGSLAQEYLSYTLNRQQFSLFYKKNDSSNLDESYLDSLILLNKSAIDALCQWRKQKKNKVFLPINQHNYLMIPTQNKITCLSLDNHTDQTIINDKLDTNFTNVDLNHFKNIVMVQLSDRLHIYTFGKNQALDKIRIQASENSVIEHAKFLDEERIVIIRKKNDDTYLDIILFDKEAFKIEKTFDLKKELLTQKSVKRGIIPPCKLESFNANDVLITFHEKIDDTTSVLLNLTDGTIGYYGDTPKIKIDYYTDSEYRIL
ncbi:MAG: hypothetical protein WDZ41_05500 [Candidatus Babeliales bacterium]